VIAKQGDKAMNKKLIIIAALVGLLGFGGSLAAGWFTKKSQTAKNQAVAKETEGTQKTDPMDARPHIPIAGDVVKIDSTTKKAMTEKQLKSLIYEIREKIDEYDSKLSNLKVREQRLQTSQNIIKKDLEELDDLRIKLAAIVVQVKDEQDKLLKSRLEIEATEQENLMSLALSYDTMDPESAAKIFTNMTQTQNDSANDAIKILYFMGDRTKAEVLAAIAEVEPAVSAFFCNKLKQIVVKD
jgi:flagellar motility protein MotE (MotC chaperone)